MRPELLLSFGRDDRNGYLDNIQIKKTVSAYQCTCSRLLLTHWATPAPLPSCSSNRPPRLPSPCTGFQRVLATISHLPATSTQVTVFPVRFSASGKVGGCVGHPRLSPVKVLSASAWWCWSVICPHSQAHFLVLRPSVARALSPPPHVTILLLVTLQLQHRHMPARQCKRHCILALHPPHPPPSAPHNAVQPGLQEAADEDELQGRHPEGQDFVRLGAARTGVQVSELLRTAGPTIAWY